MRRKHLRIWQMAGSDGRSDAVRRAVARTFRTDRRARSLGLRVARLRARSAAARARPAGGGGGCAKIAVPWYPMRSVARNFFAKGGFRRARIVAVCVFQKKTHPAPYGRPAAPCRAENACRRAAKKKYVPAPQGVSQEHGAGNAV